MTNARERAIDTWILVSAENADYNEQTMGMVVDAIIDAAVEAVERRQRPAADAVIAINEYHRGRIDALRAAIGMCEAARDRWAGSTAGNGAALACLSDLRSLLDLAEDLAERRKSDQTVGFASR